MNSRKFRFPLFTALLFGICATAVAQNAINDLPVEIRTIMQQPRYAGAIWGLRVVNVNTGAVIYDLNSQTRLLTGSVRKLYSIAVTLNELGPDYRFKTPVFRDGEVDRTGRLRGNLILVAKGDLTMGGRDNGDNTIAVTDFDHCDANNLGGAILTAPDPLAGMARLAQEVAQSGIRKVVGDVIIDDRLFQQFRVPNQELLISPIVVNDNRIDLTIVPTGSDEPALVEWRPHTKAFEVHSDVKTVGANGETEITLIQPRPRDGNVSGQIAVDYVSPLPGVPTLVQTFRVDDPSAPQDPAAFARTIFIEALKRAGVTVEARPVGSNPSGKLASPDSYSANTQLAELVSAPYGQYTKLILKVSHNLGANLSLMLFGLAHGVNTMPNALSLERATLIDQYGIRGDGFEFPTNGSGSPDSRASAATTVDLLTYMSRRPTFPTYIDSLPVLGVDGSLATIGTDSPARGKVFAKTGTFLEQGTIRAQVLAGYIDALSGQRLAYALYVNDAGTIGNFSDLIGVIEDEGRISTIIWQLN
jgi:D-alanyl-D-alanine carboxypeptidase